MLDPTPHPVQLDPATIKLAWGVLLSLGGIVAGAATLAWRALGATRTWSRRSDRSEATDDHVHGPGRTREAPEEDAPGLVARVEQLEDVTHALGKRASTVERHVLGVDLGDEAAVLEHVAEHLDTQRLQALTDERVSRRVEVRQDPPPPRPRPNGRWRGEPE